MVNFRWALKSTYSHNHPPPFHTHTELHTEDHSSSPFCVPEIVSLCPAEGTGWIKNLLRGQKYQLVFWGRVRLRFIITSCHFISSSCWPSLCWRLVWQEAMRCCRLHFALPLWPWGLYLLESKGLLCVRRMCCQLEEVNVGGFYFGISTKSDKVWCR